MPPRAVRLQIGIGLVLLVGFGVLAAQDLTKPSELYWDEIWYAGQCAKSSMADVFRDRDHPPLGFAIICGSVSMLGDNPLGWRIAPFLAGCASVGLLLAGLILLRLPSVVFLACAVVITADPLLFVLSRASMLDTLLGFAMFTGVALYARADRDGSPRWLLGAGFAVGIAMTIKWSAVALLVALWIHPLTFLDPGDRLRFDRRRAVALGVVPLVTFVAVHLALGFSVREFIGFMGVKIIHHTAYYPYGASLIGSRPYEWLALQRPIRLFAASDGPTRSAILAIGHPVGWIAAEIGAAICLLRARTRAHPVARLALLIALMQCLLWLAAPRMTLLYYMVTITPCFVFAAALPSRDLVQSRRTWGTAALSILTVAHIAYFVHVLPVLRATPIPRATMTSFGRNPFLTRAVSFPFPE